MWPERDSVAVPTMHRATEASRHLSAVFFHAFHADKNLEFGKQYRFLALRLSGLPLWDVELWEYGEWQSTTTGQPKVNSAIDQDNGSTNNFLFVVKKGVMAIYANDVRLSNVIISSANKGRIAFYALP